MVPKKSIPIDQTALDNYLSTFDKSFGSGSAFILNDDRVSQDIEVIPSDIFTLDEALGVGGLPRGRIVEIFGPESSGKTSLALQFVASVEKRGGKAHFIDAEHALDVPYAKKIGLNPDVTFVSQPENGEQALEMADLAVSSKMIDLVVVDSVAALVPKSEIEGSMGDPQMGLQARLMSQAMRKIIGKTSDTKTTIIFINQMRMKIGIMFGNPETTPGGNALKFYASVRLDVRNTGKLKKADEEPYGQKVKVKVVKNKVAPPFREAEFDLIFGEGFDTTRSLIEAAVERGKVDKSGAWYSFKGERIGQGIDNVRELLLKNNALMESIRKSLYE